MQQPPYIEYLIFLRKIEIIQSALTRGSTATVADWTGPELTCPVWYGTVAVTPHFQAFSANLAKNSTNHSTKEPIDFNTRISDEPQKSVSA